MLVARVAQANHRANPSPHEAADALESVLHEKILEYANSRGWAVVHSRMDRRATVGIGTPDFILGANGGITYWIECKRKGSKPTTEQLGRILMLKLLGHRAEIVYSFEEFLAVTSNTEPPSPS